MCRFGQGGTCSWGHGAQQVSPACKSAQWGSSFALLQPRSLRCPRLTVFFKLHEMVPKWGPLSLGTWELTVLRVSPAGRLLPWALPYDCRALGKLFQSKWWRLLWGGDWIMTPTS